MMVKLFELEMPINMEEFSGLFTPNVRKVIDALQKYRFEIRIVGGAVRDFLRGASPRDIDFATDAEPAEIMFVFDLEGIQHDDSGIQHGTIKAVFGDEIVDVTSITYKLRVDHGKVMIDRGASWEEDAARRDLTINSMSVDVEGTLYDYRNGIEDLRNQTVRFNPGSREKILADPYTILRWFKAIDLFDQPRWMKGDREIVSLHAHLVRNVLDQKRTTRLLSSLKGSKNWKSVRKLMCQTGVAPHVGITC